jgi:hypothetical protein
LRDVSPAAVVDDHLLAKTFREPVRDEACPEIIAAPDCGSDESHRTIRIALSAGSACCERAKHPQEY